MGVLVVPGLLFLWSDGDGYLGSVSVVFQEPIKFVSVDRVFGLPVGFSHEVVKQLLDKVILTWVTFDQRQHVIDENLSGLDKEF